MKKCIAVLALVMAGWTVKKVVIDDKEFNCYQSVAGDAIVCIDADKEACYDPVTGRLEPCF